IRRLDRDNEKLREQLDSRTKKLSVNKHKELREEVLRNEQQLAETLAEIKLNKRQIERIIENLKKLIERVDDVEREIKNIERRAAVPLRELKHLLRLAEEDTKLGHASRKQLKKMGFGDEEVAETGRILAAAPRKVKRVEEEAIPRAIADQARTIRIPVHMIETINKLIRTSRYLVQEIGREPTPEEIAEKMELPLDKVRKVLKIAKEPISLETPIGEEEDSHLGDFIEDKAITSPSDAVINMNLAEQTRKVLATLTPREEKVLRMRFGIGGHG